MNLSVLIIVGFQMIATIVEIKLKKIRSLWQDRWRLVYVCSIGGVAILGLFRSVLSSDRCWGACSAGWNRVTMIVTEPFFERE